MLFDRRRAQRLDVRRIADLQCRIGGRECRICDISDGGVRILAEGFDVPDEFALLFVTANRSRTCRVVWRLAPEVGAEFVDVAEDDFVQRVVG
jgi:hypothetical protein